LGGTASQPGGADDAILGDGWRDRADDLVAAGELRQTNDRRYVPRDQGFAAGRISLRSASLDSVAVIDSTSGEMLGTVEAERAFSTIHPGAVYLHMGRSYEVRELDVDGRRAIVEPFDGDWYTQPKKETNVYIDAIGRKAEPGGIHAGVELYTGEVSVSEQVIAYQRKTVKDQEVIDLTALNLPEQNFSTRALWYVLPDELAGPEALPPEHRAKARVIFQSTPARPPLAKPAGPMEVVMVGHLRTVKAPEVLWAAARALAGRADIRITHIGDGAAEPALAAEALATARAAPCYRWLGALPHAQTLDRIRAAHVLVHTSAMEGGAHVVMEAVRCGTPVLASQVPGNVGMLGAGYDGYFPAGDGAALAALLRACRAVLDPEDPGPSLLERLTAQCALRDPLFEAGAERTALLSLLQELEVPA